MPRRAPASVPGERRRERKTAAEFERCAGVAGVIETPIEKNPAQPPLRLDEGAAQIGLNSAGGEIIVLVYRSACVECAANGRSERRGRPVRSQIMLPISAVSPLHHRARRC